MGCTRRFLNFTWEHHHWRRQVTLAENLPSQETDMWGRVMHPAAVRCQKQEVCEACGKTRGEQSCFCDPEYADHCAIRVAWIEESKRQAAP